MEMCLCGSIGREYDADVFYHVRVGPFTDPELLDQSRQKLGDLGIETQMLKERK